MKQLKNKRWTVYLIHHAHTDIGYTEIQEDVIANHVRYIREAIRILNSGAYPGFCWSCEGLWAVEEFLKAADKTEKADFVRHVKSGGIGLSGSYLNLTELIDATTMYRTAQRVISQLKELGLEIKSAMTADINGYAWGYTDILADLGIENLASFINDYNGAVPFGKRQNGFWWESPSGRRILTWVGNHYHQGNEVGLCFGYMLTLEETLAEVEEKLPAYLAGLEADGYAFDFCPLGVSGIFDDNAPPNARIAELVEAWNLHHGDEIEIRMEPISAFFARLRAEGERLPVAKGDWSDWWGDGVGSTPLEVKMYKDAQRRHAMCLLLDPAQTCLTQEQTAAAEHAAAMYAEHTWGHCGSVWSPWTSIAGWMDARKTMYACTAHVTACKNLDIVLAAKGKAGKLPHPSLKYKVVNPYDAAWSGYVCFARTDKDKRVVTGAKDESGRQYPIQKRDHDIWTYVALEPQEERCISLLPGEKAEDVCALQVSETQVETPFYKILLSKEKGGIYSILDKQIGHEMVRSDADAAAFQPIYERTEGDNPVASRDALAAERTRHNETTVRSYANLEKIEVVQTGALWAKLRLSYQMPGAGMTIVELLFFAQEPQFEVNLILHKDSVWQAESVYLALPFTKVGDTLWIDKTGCVLRPAIDQLPNACQSFFVGQSGTAFLGEQGGAVVGCPDAPLLWLGDVKENRVRFCQNEPADNRLPLYSWVMNNYWVTNFKATLGGFHSFRYTFMSDPAFTDPTAALAEAKRRTDGVLAFPVAEEE